VNIVAHERIALGKFMEASLMFLCTEERPSPKNPRESFARLPFYTTIDFFGRSVCRKSDNDYPDIALAVSIIIASFTSEDSVSFLGGTLEDLRTNWEVHGSELLRQLQWCLQPAELAKTTVAQAHDLLFTLWCAFWAVIFPPDAQSEKVNDSSVLLVQT